uniref:L antigen family member 3 n=1 Tax=Sus scrofa TaxID=9823 RepID=F1S0K0_PIG
MSTQPPFPWTPPPARDAEGIGYSSLCSPIRSHWWSAAAMQAADAARPGHITQSSTAGGPEGPGCRGGPGGPSSPRGDGCVAADAAEGVPPVAPGWHPSAAGGESASTAKRPGNRPLVFTLSVPFPSSLEAEIARGSLAPDAEPHRGAAGKKLSVSASVLAVHWRAEDSRLLRISILNFLDQLSLAIRTMQRFGPPVIR